MGPICSDESRLVEDCWRNPTEPVGRYLQDSAHGPHCDATWSGRSVDRLAVGRGVFRRVEDNGDTDTESGTLARRKKTGRWNEEPSEGAIREGHYRDGEE